MKERIYRTLNIKMSESNQVFDLLTVQFFIGLANALINIIAFTLFVYHFEVHYLAEVYLVTAVALMILNRVYEYLEHKYSPLTLLRIVIAFSVAVLLFLWVGLTFFDKSTYIFSLLVSSVLLYMLTGYAFWGLVSLLFNVRESRRVFSIVGSGDIPAKLIGYIAAPLLIPIVGMNNVLWLAIIAMATGYILFGKFIKKKSWNIIKAKSQHDHEQHHHAHISGKKGFVSFFFQNKLIFAISLLSILSYNVFILIDYTFISQVKVKSSNISELASYIAVFFALGRVIAIVFKLIFTSRVIEKLGVISSLFITPVFLFLFCMLFFFFGDKSMHNLFIFGLMAMFTEVLRSTMQEPVFFILFQPLKENLRLKGHIISKGYMYPPSLIIVGLSLYFCYKLHIDVGIHLTVKVIVINLGIWVAVIFLIRKNYLNAVHASIKRGTFHSDDTYINDQHTIQILLDKIASGNKMEVIYALNLLEQSAYPETEVLLKKQLTLSSADVEVKKYAMERLEAKKAIDIEVLYAILLQEKEGLLQQKAFAMLCKLDPDYLKTQSVSISDHPHVIRKIITIQLLNQQEFDYLFLAGSEINKLVNSTDAEERHLAIDVISEVKHVQFSDAMKHLIVDSELIVRRAAVDAVCKLKLKTLLPEVLSLLGHDADKNIVLKGLQLYGDPFFDDIKTFPRELQDEYETDFIRIATRMKGNHSTEFLLARLDAQGIIRDKIVHAFWFKEYFPSHTIEKGQFHLILNDYLRSGLEKISDYYEVPDFSDTTLVKNSILNEVKSDLASALKICSLVYQKKEINRILELLSAEATEKIYNAMEMLELLLPKKISSDLNELFDFVLDPVHNKKVSYKTDKHLFLQKVMFRSSQLYNPWTRAVCIYSSWRSNDRDLIQKLRDQQNKTDHRLVMETRAFVLQSLNQ